MSSRIEKLWEEAQAERRKLLIPFIMAGDPTHVWSEELLHALPEAGADIIELGMPFSDPMADGPVIQQAGRRALKHGIVLADILALVKKFRVSYPDVPLVLMGYYNPIYHYGVGRFISDACEAGVDALIVVDLPLEEDKELCVPAMAAGLDFIRMVTPVTDEARAREILEGARGFVYAVSIAGITGTKKAGDNAMADLARRIETASDLPKAIGFGIRTPDDARAAARYFDAVVVGSAIVERIDSGDLSKSKDEIVQLLTQMKQAMTA